MIIYKNISSYPLTFYGVTFNPNESKEVPGYINHTKMVRVTEKVSPKPKAVISESKVQPIAEQPKKRSYNRKSKIVNQ